MKRPIDFDARFEPWYIDSINHPKEIVVVLDSSGSMKGFRQILAILTIRTIISTLGDNDYFNVIHFNDQEQSFILREMNAKDLLRVDS